jgi:acetyl-CoA carboxylase biotin carboxylase subunit
MKIYLVGFMGAGKTTGTAPEVLARARRALEQFIIEGVKTSIPLHRAILDDPRFIARNFSTRFMETFER